MVTKNKNRDEKAATKGRVKVGKLQLNKETVKDLTAAKQKQVKGGAPTSRGCGVVYQPQK